MNPDHDVTAVLLGGVLGGVASTLVFYPLECVEAVAQVDQRFARHGIARGIRELYNQGGIAALFRGWFPTAIGCGVNWAVYFALLQVVGALIEDALGASVAVKMLVGIVVGCMTCVVANPFWVIKTRQVLDGSSSPAAAVRIASKMIRTEGILHMWSGVVASWAGSLEGALQMVLHHRAVEWMKLHEESDPATLFVVACIARMLAVLACYPINVVRANVIKDDKAAGEGASHKKHDDPETAGGGRVSAVSALRHVLQTRGWTALYAGAAANLLRQAPAAGVLFVVNDQVARLYHAMG